MKKRIFLASPNMSKEGYEQKYVKEAFDTNWVAPLGENVNKFEEEIANYVGIKHAAALTSGTAAKQQSSNSTLYNSCRELFTSTSQSR